MSIEQLKTQLQALPKDERRQLSRFLISMEIDEDADHWKTIRSRADDPDPDNWVSLADLRKS